MCKALNQKKKQNKNMTTKTREIMQSTIRVRHKISGTYNCQNSTDVL